MNPTISKDVIEAVTTITDSDEPFVWIRVSRRRNTPRLVTNFHQAVQRALVRAKLYWPVSRTTRKNTLYLLIDRRGRG